MKIHSIYHSGVLVELETLIILIDYYKGDLPIFDQQKPFYVLCSHAHQDHYNPIVYDLTVNIKEKYFIFSRDIQKKNKQEAIYMRINDTYHDQHLTIHTLQSTDTGVAFLIEAEDKVIYHAGDLNDWQWAEETEQVNKQMHGSFMHEIKKLKNRSIDVGFVVLDGRQEKYAYSGILETMKMVDISHVVPIHYSFEEAIVERFLHSEEALPYLDKIVNPIKQKAFEIK